MTSVTMMLTQNQGPTQEGYERAAMWLFGLALALFTVAFVSH